VARRVGSGESVDVEREERGFEVLSFDPVKFTEAGWFSRLVWDNF